MDRNAVSDSVQRGQGDAGRQMEGLQRANDLVYRLPPSLSVVTKRQQVRQFFDKDSYGDTSGTMTCRLNTGDLYVDGRRSYLTFEVIATGASATFGVGSALNVIREIRLTTESGVEIERITNVNLMARFRDNWMNDEGWFESVGTVAGYTPRYKYDRVYATGMKLGNDDPIDAGSAQVILRKQKAADLNNVKNKRHFVIPLSCIAGLFNQSKLLPGLGLCSGLKVDITLESFAIALVGAGATGYSISRPAIVLDTYQLSDGVLKMLNQQSATSSLEYAFDTWDTSQKAESTTALSIESKKAVSRANMAFAVSRLDAKLAVAEDSMAAEQFLVETQQWQLACLFLPNNAVQSFIPDAGYYDVAEQYQNALYAWGKFADHTVPTNARYNEFTGVTQVQTTADPPSAPSNEGKGCMACVLERSSVLQGSGLPLSGSRILQLRATYFTATPRTIHLFTNYTKLVRVFLDRAIVKE